MTSITSNGIRTKKNDVKQALHCINPTGTVIQKDGGFFNILSLLPYYCYFCPILTNRLQHKQFSKRAN